MFSFHGFLVKPEKESNVFLLYIHVSSFVVCKHLEIFCNITPLLHALMHLLILYHCVKSDILLQAPNTHVNIRWCCVQGKKKQKKNPVNPEQLFVVQNVQC